MTQQSSALSKLPAITASFWVMKISATTLGETAGDLLSMTMNIGYAVSSLILISLFFIALGVQLLSQHHRPFLYWTVIVSTSTAGTTMSDYMDRTLQLGYTKGSLILVSILFSTLVFWRISVGNLSVDNVKTRKAEFLYWITILFSNTLGTALGDFLADDSGLGFGGSWLLITGILVVITAMHFYTRISKIFLFWLAFILTRPFGATFGDLLTKTHEKGGFDLGTINASLILAGILIATILYTRDKTPSALDQSN